MATADLSWQPSRIVQVIEGFPTGSSVVRVETDQGEGFLKALSNKAEPHHLVSELVGTQLARWLKLPTLTFSLLANTEQDRIQLADGTFAHPGPAFITRVEEGIPWGGAAVELDLLDNPGDVARLVVFDTWTRNCDRYMPRESGARINRDNVFLSRRSASKGHLILKAIDHGCCFTCARELTVKLRDLDNMRDDRLYGCFPQFAGRIERPRILEVLQEVEAVQKSDVEQILRIVPRDWAWNEQIGDALCDFICQRAKYIREIFSREWPLPEGEPGQERQS